MKLAHTTENLLFKRDGTCQTERVSQKLVANELLMDEKTLDEHIVFVYLYSDLIKYYDSQNSALDHNVWRTFLENDDTVIRALILHTNIANLRSTLNSKSFSRKQKKTIALESKHFKELLSILKELLLLLNYWYKNLSDKDTIKLEIYSFITNELNDRISLLYQLLQQTASDKASSTTLQDFYAFIEQVCDGPNPWVLKSISINKSDLESETNQPVLMHLTASINIILNEIIRCKKLVADTFPKTLKSQQHQPPVALLIAFLRLLKYVSESSNQIPQRHLDYYYKEILKFAHKSTRPDNVYVYFELEEDVPHYFLEKGAKLLAGKDSEGNDIIFETDKPITLNRSTISKIYTIHRTVEHHSDDVLVPLGSITTTTHTPSELNEQHALTFRTFKKNTANKQAPSKQWAGLVIVSPIFHLQEGNREITLTFQFSQASFKAFTEKIATIEDKNLDSSKDKLAQTFKEAINTQLTAEEGWLSLEKSFISTTISKNGSCCIEIKLLLGPTIPPIVNFSREIHGDHYDIAAPALRLALDNPTLFGQIYPFRNLILEKLSINVAVTDYRGAILQNDLGLIDSNQPFQPFGPIPKLHANFYIGSDEVFCKNLKALNINIDWENLPQLDDGFEGYYASYPQKVTNSDFKVNVSYLHHRQWHPFYPENRQEIRLFSAEENQHNNSKRLNAKRVIDEVAISKLGISKSNYVLDPPLLTNKTLTGFIKMELCGPSMAFGHGVYPNLMRHVLTHNTDPKNKMRKVAEPNEPYTPSIKSLSIDYSAKEEINFTSNNANKHSEYNESVLKLFPFGYKRIFPSNELRPISFVLDLDSEGYFFFGFENVPLPTILSLYIHMDEGSGNPDKNPPQPSWKYLAYNNWISFKDDEVISDSTHGLTKSGIIEFSIPKKTSKQHTSLNPGFVWIKAVFSKDVDALPDIVGIYTQGVSASRVIEQDNTMEQSKRLLPSTIQSLIDSPAEIKSVVQPFPSFGGKPAEDEKQFYTRVSERLRHKNRAISAWDYERIILEKFPEVFRVKCINHAKMSDAAIPHPGSITIVVISDLSNQRSKNELMPKASKYLLAQIQRYLKKVVSPFVNLEVINPLYEEIKVAVEVAFKKGYEKGGLSNKLQREIKNFLSPWLFKKSEDVRLGGMIPSSKIVDFISRRKYVEGVGKFSILKYTNKEDTLRIVKITDYDNYLRATFPWSIMVSADKHEILVVDKIQSKASQHQGGVESMGIDEDFVVGPWKEIKGKDRAIEKTSETLQESLEEYYLVTKKHIK